jgi:hypothetical protein
MMKRSFSWGLLTLLFCSAMPALAFDSGSTGADGSLTPNVNTEVQLPPSGVLNYASINIPSGVTVRFRRNALNTPVTLLVSGNATIAGIIEISGGAAPGINGADGGNVADDGLPGVGGPGGFAGGNGGQADPSTAVGSRVTAQAGLGPGGGRPQTTALQNRCSGSGGSFASAGQSASTCGGSSAIYGNVDLLPLIGGSGGAGGAGTSSTGGAGGGGGAGALLMAVSGTLNLTGSILAVGGAGGSTGQGFFAAGGGVGGGGSGGAVRLIASTLSGNGPITATAGAAGRYSDNNAGYGGGVGRIRLEADVLTRTAQTDPAFTTSTPGPLNVAGVPTIRIASVAGVAAPASPTGNADIVLPAATPNPVAVTIETTNVPLGNTVSLITTPPRGLPVTTTSTALVGSLAAATASASADIGDGSSVLLATLSFAVVGAQQLALAHYTNGEKVVRVELAAALSNSGAKTVLITESGRRVTM